MSKLLDTIIADGIDNIIYDAIGELLSDNANNDNISIRKVLSTGEEVKITIDDNEDEGLTINFYSKGFIENQKE